MSTMPNHACTLRSTDCKQLDEVVRAFTEIEEVSKKSCIPTWKLYTFCQSPLNTFLVHLPSPCVFLVGISEFDLLCNMRFLPFLLVILGEF